MAEKQSVTFEPGWPAGITAAKLNQWDGCKRITTTKHDGTYGCEFSCRNVGNWMRWPIVGQPYQELWLTLWYHPGGTYGFHWHPIYCEFRLTNGLYVGLWFECGVWYIHVNRSDKGHAVAAPAGWHLITMHLNCLASGGVFEYNINNGTMQTWVGDTLLGSGGIWGFNEYTTLGSTANPKLYIDTMSFYTLGGDARVYGPAVQCGG